MPKKGKNRGEYFQPNLIFKFVLFQKSILNKINIIYPMNDIPK